MPCLLTFFPLKTRATEPSVGAELLTESPSVSTHSMKPTPMRRYRYAWLEVVQSVSRVPVVGGATTCNSCALQTSTSQQERESDREERLHWTMPSIHKSNDLLVASVISIPILISEPARLTQPSRTLRPPFNYTSSSYLYFAFLRPSSRAQSSIMLCSQELDRCSSRRFEKFGLRTSHDAVAVYATAFTLSFAVNPSFNVALT